MIECKLLSTATSNRTFEVDERILTTHGTEGLHLTVRMLSLHKMMLMRLHVCKAHVLVQLIELLIVFQLLFLSSLKRPHKLLLSAV